MGFPSQVDLRKVVQLLIQLQKDVTITITMKREIYSHWHLKKSAQTKNNQTWKNYWYVLQISHTDQYNFSTTVKVNKPQPHFGKQFGSSFHKDYTINPMWRVGPQTLIWCLMIPPRVAGIQGKLGQIVDSQAKQQDGCRSHLSQWHREISGFHSWVSTIYALSVHTKANTIFARGGVGRAEPPITFPSHSARRTRPVPAIKDCWINCDVASKSIL